MAKKKAAKKKLTKKKPTRKPAVAKKVARKAAKKAAPKPAKASAAKQAASTKKIAAKRAVVAQPAKQAASPVQRTRDTRSRQSLESDNNQQGLGSGSAGQAGDLQGLSRKPAADSESVEELVEEGQAWEASAISGVEDADGDPAEVRTHEVPEDDVPEEYLDDRENQ